MKIIILFGLLLIVATEAATQVKKNPDNKNILHDIMEVSQKGKKSFSFSKYLNHLKS